MFSIFKKNNFDSISIYDLNDMLGKINLIDIRENYEYKSGHIPTAKNIPMNAIVSCPEKYISKSEEYYIVCQSGVRSARTCRQLLNQGYNVVNVSGGTGAYASPFEK